MLANLLRAASIDGAVIGIDTFLGGPEHWHREGPLYGTVTRQNGHPILYEQFLANVVRRGLERYVVPFPKLPQTPR